MTSLNQLATRLRLNAASMEHGEAEADIRAAADILDSFADAGEIEFCGSRYSPFRDMASKCLVPPKRIAEAFSKAYIRAWERTAKPCS